MSGMSKIPLHVDAKLLKETAKELLPDLTGAPSDTPPAFLSAVITWLERWLAKHGEEALGGMLPFVLLCPPDIVALNLAVGWTEEPFFREAKPLPLGGKIIATTTSMLEVRVLESQATDLPSLGRKLIELGFRECPMLIIDPANAMSIHCANGLAGHRMEMDLQMAPIVDLTELLVDSHLDQFHIEYTRYPNGFCAAWHDRPAGVIRSDAEEVVRNDLFLYFKNVAFRSCYIIREEHTSVGRSDISIIDTRLGNRLACIFELKVLRTRGMNRKSGAGSRSYTLEVMTRHARMGVRQAKKYKDVAKPSPQWAYLCVYDGRDEDTSLPDVETLAGTSGVLYRKYYMERSTRDDLGE
jgi:hypothetical protein